MKIQDDDFREFASYIKRDFGINLSSKKILVEGRLGLMLANKGFENFRDYFIFVKNDPTGAELNELLNRVTTNHTFFMREKVHFDFFRSRVLPELKTKVKDQDLRIWSAGCSTGEEPYTLAIILDECFGFEKHQWDTKILATDISQRALEAAETGRYPEEALEQIPSTWKKRYFKPCGNQEYQVQDKIRSEVIFRTLNLMDHHFPFRRKFHAIFCRNVMIYFDNPTKLQLVQKYYDLTEPGGYLFIGHSESINRLETGYSYVMPAIYQKKG